MTHFEYIAVAKAIVFSFAVLRLLDALPHVAAQEKRYSIHALWVAMLLFWCAQFWWVSWASSAREGEFSFPLFLLMMAPPGLFYLSATALVSHAPADVPSWREHFWQVRRRFFGCILALVISLILFSTVAMEADALSPIRLAHPVAVCLFFTGLVSEKERTHRIVAGLAAAVFATLFVLTFVGVDLTQ
jgi:hypothetical protein